jgi:hypothetical protein
MSSQILVKDQTWYGKLPGNPFLRNLLITEVTAKTVCVTEVQVNKLQQQAPIRFKIEDVDFVEEMPPAEETSKVII